MTNYLELLGRHQYAIVDCARMFPEPWTEVAPMKPLVPDELRSDAHNMPALLPLDPKRSWFAGMVEDLTRNEEINYPQSVANLLMVQGDVDLLVKHLTSRLIIHFLDGKKAYLKYFDVDTFVHLKRILRPAELQSLYGPVTAWTVYFRRGWHTEPAPGVPAGEVPASWKATAEQLAALERIRLVNQVLSYWRSDLDRPWASIDEFRAYAAHADAILVEERQARPDAWDEAVVGAVRRQFPRDFRFQP